MSNILLFAVFQPTPGLAFWSLIFFLLFWLIIGKMAFKPIVSSLKTRENDIQKALDAAKEAKEEMQSLKAENDKILAEAREERSRIIAEAKEMGNGLVADAKNKAKEEANRMISNAKKEIEAEKNNALSEVKKEAGSLAVAIAEQLLKKELSGATKQGELIETMMNIVNSN